MRWHHQGLVRCKETRLHQAGHRPEAGGAGPVVGRPDMPVSACAANPAVAVSKRAARGGVTRMRPKPIINTAPMLPRRVSSRPLVWPRVATNSPSATKEMPMPAARYNGPRLSLLAAEARTMGRIGKTHGLISVSSPARYAKNSSIIASVWQNAVGLSAYTGSQVC